MTSWNDISGLSGPWVHRVTEETEEALAPTASEWSGRILRLDGARMRTLDSLFLEYAREFEFPAYFGENWPAFHECMTELAELPARGYLTLISHGDAVLAEDPDDLPTFLRLLGEIGKYWAHSFGLGPDWAGGEVPFHTVFVVPAAASESRSGRK